MSLNAFNLADLLHLITHLLNAEDTIHNGFRFAAGTTERRTLNSQRKPHQDTIHFQLAEISDEEQALGYWGSACDISDTGVGLTISYHLQPDQIIGFGTYLGNRMAVVVWSSMLDEQTCRAAIKFG